MLMEKRILNGHRDGPLELNDYFITTTIQSVPASVAPSKLLPSYFPIQSDGGELRYIEHHVSKFDTLAGVAIKYGVEVVDIKKMNGLVTDHQMFALNTLHIPLPGRHPPSPILASGVDNKSCERTPPARRHSDLLDSFQSLKLESSSHRQGSPATSYSQGYYGLKKPAEMKVHPEGIKMNGYNNEGSLQDGISIKSSPASLPRKCRSVDSGFYPDKRNLATQEDKYNDWGVRWIEKFVRMRPKSEMKLKSSARERLLKEENKSGGVFSALASKGLSLRPKSGNRNVSRIDDEGRVSTLSGDPLLEPLLTDSNGVRKSSSAPSFQDSEDGTSSSSLSLSSIWSTSKWSLKPDLQALSSAVVVSKPITLPITGRKSKQALD